MVLYVDSGPTMIYKAVEVIWILSAWNSNPQKTYAMILGEFNKFLGCFFYIIIIYIQIFVRIETKTKVSSDLILGQFAFLQVYSKIGSYQNQSHTLILINCTHIR